jgi:cytochrome c
MKTCAALSVCMYLMACAGAALAAETGTKDEAIAMVKKALQFIKANGKDKAFAEFSNTKGRFVDRDLYIAVYDMTGTCLAHGQKPNMVGKDLIGMKDPDGREFIKERVELMKKQRSAWQDYKFMNPLNKQIEPKQMYIERVDDFIVGCGAYRK